MTHMLTSTGFYIIGASPPVWHAALFDISVEKALVGKQRLMGQASRKCHALHTGRESLEDSPRKKTEGRLEDCHSDATKGVAPSSERWTHGKVRVHRPVCYPLIGAAVWAALPQSHLLKNTPTQPNEAAIYKAASSGSGGLVIVTQP